MLEAKIEKILSSMKLTETGKALKASLTDKGCQLRVGYGGAKAGITYYILQEIIAQCVGFQPGQLWMGKQIPNLTVIIVAPGWEHKDWVSISHFRNIMKENEYWNGAYWDAKQCTYSFPNEVQIQFLDCETDKNPPNTDCQIYFLNWADWIPWEYFNKIQSQCTGYGWLDFNPTQEFWLHTKIAPNAQRYNLGVLGGLTYRGNQFAAKTSVHYVEKIDKRNPLNWRIHGEGYFNDERLNL